MMNKLFTIVQLIISIEPAHISGVFNGAGGPAAQRGEVR
jgi:hypothetical protein